MPPRPNAGFEEHDSPDGLPLLSSRNGEISAARAAHGQVLESGMKFL